MNASDGSRSRTSRRPAGSRPSVSPLSAAYIGAAVSIAAALLVGTFSVINPGSDSSSCNSNNNGTTNCTIGPCPDESDQCLYQALILKDQRALRQGYVLVQRNISIPLGQPSIFVATVCGPNVVNCDVYDFAGVSSIKSEPSQFQGGLLIGARVQATLAGDMPGSIHNLSSDTQPVITSTSNASWMWDLRPSRGGNFDLILALTPLRGSTNSPLTVGAHFLIKVNVTMSSWQKVTSAGAAMRDFLTSLGGLLSALGVTFTTVALWVLRRARKMRRARPHSAARETVPAMDDAAIDHSRPADNKKVSADPS
jgi:hypothetical protein